MNNFRRKALNHGAHWDRRDQTETLDDKFRRGLQLHQNGQLGPAATLYGEVIEQDPEHFDALHLLGVAAHQTGNSLGALGLIDKAIAVRPDIADAHSNRSAVLMELGRTEDALQSCERALDLDPTSADAWFNAGNARAKLGDSAGAVEHYERAVKIRPNYVAALTNLGSELLELGKPDLAKKVLTKAVEIDSTHAKAHLNLGVAWLETGEKAIAKSSFEAAAKADPAYPKPWVNLSNIAYSEGRLTDAANCANEAQQRGARGDAGNAIGNCYRALGMPEKACEAFQAAVDNDPSAHASHSNLLLAMLSDPVVTGEEVFIEANKWAARHAPWSPATPRPTRPMKRIGFVSGDFRIHPVGFFLEPLLKNLEDVEVFLYANQLDHDRQSASLAKLCTAWRPCRHQSTDELIDTVRQDEIDVLIDLSGHTSDGRLDVFAKHAAPVQLTWLGYSGTTGMSQFDGLIADPIVVPWTDEEHYSEPIVRLSNTFAPCFDVSEFPAVEPTPALAKGFVTFGCFNATTKINDKLISTWAKILKSVEDSRLILKNLFYGDLNVQDRVAKAFAAHGVHADRLIFVAQTSRDEHFSWFAQVDIALDTFPYSGATTTIDNLAMGVPVVTLAGDRYAGRMSASFLTALGLNELIGETTEHYVDIAVDLGSNLPALNDLRQSVRPSLLRSSLNDHSAFATDFMRVLTETYETRIRSVA